MRTIFLVIVALVFASNRSHAQRTVLASNGEPIIIEYLLQGDSLFKAGDLKESIDAYKKEYLLYPTMACYGLACAYARDRQPDSAFKYLNEDLEYDSTTFILTNPDFLSLREDTRWNSIIHKSTNNIIARNPGDIQDLSLAKKLWDMFAWDQAYFYELAIADRKLGMQSPVSKCIRDYKEKSNLENHRLLDSIFEIKGWPLISQVGSTAAQGAILILQNHSLEKQKQYLPIIKELCLAGEASWENYAHVYDGVQIAEKGTQFYGTHFIRDDNTLQYSFYPIEDEKNINKRRKEMGMATIEDYARRFGVTYIPK